MRLGIGRHRNLEVRDAPQPGDQVGGERHSRPGAAHRPHPAAHRRAARRCGARRLPSIAAPPRPPRSRLAPTQVRCAAGTSAGLAHDARHRGMGALPRAAAGTVGDRDEARRAAAPAGGCRSRAAVPAPRSSAERTRMTAAAADASRPRAGSAAKRGPVSQRSSVGRPESPVRPSGRSFMASLPQVPATRQGPIARLESDVARRPPTLRLRTRKPQPPACSQWATEPPCAACLARLGSETGTCASSEEPDARRHPPSPSGDHRRAAGQPGRLRHAAARQTTRTLWRTSRRPTIRSSRPTAPSMRSTTASTR